VVAVAGSALSNLPETAVILKPQRSPRLLRDLGPILRFAGWYRFQPGSVYNVSNSYSLKAVSLMDPTQFFGLPSPGLDAADALILPWPLEKTVSYGTGTQTGPAAIIASSPQIEFFEEETRVDFTQRPRLHTLPPIEVEPVMSEEHLPMHLTETAGYISRFRERFLVTLGGEHLLTYGVVTGLAADPAEVTIVQIDAHADLADKLGGRHWSHGTVMRRLWEHGCRLVQIGIRSLSRPEFELVESGPRIETFFAHDLDQRWSELQQTLARLEGPVYLSLDVDGLDPGIVPSTGTPQPNGLSWPQVMELIRAVAAAPCDWIGADVVEFIASPHPPGCDLTVARLVTKILAYWSKR
jgi:agmatinase